MRIVIIGDIHLYDLSFRPWRLMGKRLLGQTNLWLHRRHAFNPKLLAPVMERAMSLQPDWLIFTGDLTTTALDSEFKMAAKALEPWLERDRVMVVPGNHDRYTYRAARRRRFEVFMGKAAPTLYPHVVDLSPHWRMIGIDSCCPRLVTSRGRVGRRQMDKIQQVIKETPKEQGLLVVCHYPVEVPPGYNHRWSHQLADADELAHVLKQAAGPVVFVHGHIHRPWHWRALELENVDSGPFRIINAGSPCMTSSSYPAGQGFWAMELAYGDTDTGIGAGTQATGQPTVQPSGQPRLESLIAHRLEYEAAEPALSETTRSGVNTTGPMLWRVQPQSLDL